MFVCFLTLCGTSICFSPLGWVHIFEQIWRFGSLWTMVHGASGGIISQDLLYIIGEDKQQSWINQIVLSAKVQLISECLLGLIDFPKKQRNI